MLKKQVEPGTSLTRQSVKIKTILHQSQILPTFTSFLKLVEGGNNLFS